MKITAAMEAALGALPVELGSCGAPHPNTLRALVARGLAAYDWSANDGFNAVPPEVRRTPSGDAYLAESRRP